MHWTNESSGPYRRIRGGRHGSATGEGTPAAVLIGGTETAHGRDRAAPRGFPVPAHGGQPEDLRRGGGVRPLRALAAQDRRADPARDVVPVAAASCADR